MRYYFIEPEVAGGLGPNTIADKSVHPPLVTYLNYQFDGWLGDAILESYPVFIIVEDAKSALLRNSITGVRLDEVEVTTSEQFKDIYPDKKLPRFAWLQIIGRAGEDDFGIAADNRLVISERALDVLKQFNISHAVIEAYPK
jgi:hypothetical protein